MHQQEVTSLVTRLDVSMWDDRRTLWSEGRGEQAADGPTYRAVRLRLYMADQLIGEWRITAADVNVPVSTREVLMLRARFAGLRSAYHLVTSPLGPFVQAAAKRLLSEVRAEQLRHRSQPDVALPAHVSREMGDALNRFGSAGRPLWLTLSEPSLYLAFVNWERLVGEAVSCPLLRLPYYPLDPILTATSLEVLLCCPGNALTSKPMELDIIRGIALAIFRGVGDRPCTIHVFSDASSYKRLHQVDGSNGNATHQRIHVYDPQAWQSRWAAAAASQAADAATHGSPRRKRRAKAAAMAEAAELKSSVADHPWMTWLKAELRGRAMDICHIVGSGELIGGDASLVIPSDPFGQTDAKGRTGVAPARLVTAPYLASVLDVVGAPAALLSMSRGPISRIAGRGLADQVARRHPSSLAVHDLGRDRRFANVERLYRFLTTRAPTMPPCGPDITLFCHPAQVMEVPDVPPSLETSLAEALRAARGAARQLVDRPGPTPVWFAVAQRVLEQAVGEYLVESPVANREEASHEGRRAALEFVSRVLAQPETLDAASRSERRME